MVAIGGGGGGANGLNGGGGSGFVESGRFAVNPGDTFTVVVGSGGAGAVGSFESRIAWNTDGGASSFGELLLSRGGKTPTSEHVGGDGGSGGSAGGA